MRGRGLGRRDFGNGFAGSGFRVHFCSLLGPLFTGYSLLDFGFARCQNLLDCLSVPFEAPGDCRDRHPILKTKRQDFVLRVRQIGWVKIEGQVGPFGRKFSCLLLLRSHIGLLTTSTTISFGNQD